MFGLLPWKKKDRKLEKKKESSGYYIKNNCTIDSAPHKGHLYTLIPIRLVSEHVSPGKDILPEHVLEVGAYQLLPYEASCLYGKYVCNIKILKKWITKDNRFDTKQPRPDCLPPYHERYDEEFRTFYISNETFKSSTIPIMEHTMFIQCLHHKTLLWPYGGFEQEIKKPWLNAAKEDDICRFSDISSFQDITIRLATILNCTMPGCRDALMPGVEDVISNYKETIKCYTDSYYANLYKVHELNREVRRFLEDVCFTIRSMGGFLEDENIRHIERILLGRSEEIKIVEKKKAEEERAKEEKTSALKKQIDSRRELLREFNKV